MSTRLLESPAAQRQPPAIAAAATRQRSARRIAWLERWHLLSLDAPTVATVWTWFLARSFRAAVYPWTLAAMFLAVWILYAGDRLLDARAARSGVETELEERHYFHARHHRRFLVAIGVAVPLLCLALFDMPRRMLGAYVAMSLILAAWLAVIHTCARPARLPKEIAVGLFFASAVSLPALAHSPATASIAATTTCLALMASANCLYLLRWESRQQSHASAAHPSARLALRHLAGLLLTALLLCMTVAAATLPHRAEALPAACCALSLCLLSLLDRNQQRFAPVTLRALADAVLLTPLLMLLPFHASLLGVFAAR